MKPETRRLIGNVVLAIGIIVVIVNLAGMSGVITKVATSRELNTLAFVLVIAGGGLRRSGKTTPAPPTQP